MAYRIGMTGDVMLGRLLNDRYRGNRPDEVWGTMLDRLRLTDGLIINLECCLSNRGSPWRRTYRRFHFRADPEWAIEALRTVGIDVCSLANNHVLDYGEIALMDTVNHLDDADIAYTGAGISRADALEPAVIDIDGVAVAVIAFTDNVPEYAAGENTPGTAYITADLDSERTQSSVTTALERVRDSNPDLVIASLHWGPNMVERPPESFRRFARWLIDTGVDVIFGHSAHLFHGIEVYDGKPIMYDTGDFVDDYAVDPVRRNDRSFLFELHVDGAGSMMRLRLIPTEISGYSVDHANPDAARWSRSRMRTLSREFGTSFDSDGADLVIPLCDG